MSSANCITASACDYTSWGTVVTQIGDHRQSAVNRAVFCGGDRKCLKFLLMEGRCREYHGPQHAATMSPAEYSKCIANGKFPLTCIQGDVGFGAE